VAGFISVVAALGGFGMVALAGSASAVVDAPDNRPMDIAGTSECDTTTGEWKVSWQVTNLFSDGATISNVQTSPSIELAGDKVAPGASTVIGTQRLPGSNGFSMLKFDVTWDNGEFTTGYDGQVKIPMQCTKAVQNNLRVEVRASALECDSTRGEWVVRWTVRNPTGAGVQIQNVSSSPNQVSLPEQIGANETVTADTRVPDTSLGLLNFDVVYGNGQVIRETGQFKPSPVERCQAA
jgi:hypothetical protein